MMLPTQGVCNAWPKIVWCNRRPGYAHEYAAGYFYRYAGSCLQLQVGVMWPSAAGSANGAMHDDDSCRHLRTQASQRSYQPMPRSFQQLPVECYPNTARKPC